MEEETAKIPFGIDNMLMSICYQDIEYLVLLLFLEFEFSC